MTQPEWLDRYFRRSGQLSLSVMLLLAPWVVVLFEEYSPRTGTLEGFKGIKYLYVGPVYAIGAALILIVGLPSGVDVALPRLLALELSLPTPGPNPDVGTAIRSVLVLFLLGALAHLLIAGVLLHPGSGLALTTGDAVVVAAVLVGSVGLVLPAIRATAREDDQRPQTATGRTATGDGIARSLLANAFRLHHAFVRFELRAALRLRLLILAIPLLLAGVPFLLANIVQFAISPFTEGDYRSYFFLVFMVLRAPFVIARLNRADISVEEV